MRAECPDPIEIEERDDWLTTAEAARWLKLRPRTVYHLVAGRHIPHAKAHGRLLFSRAQLAAWLDTSGGGRSGATTSAPPPLIAGSHDPLLEWAVERSGCELQLDARGSRDGLERLVQRRACAALIHLPNERDDGFNDEALRSQCAHLPVVSMQWALREQGLIVARGNPLGIDGIEALLSRRHAVVMRQAAAGSNLLFAKLVRRAGGRLSQLSTIEPRAHSETELARAVALGHADAGFGIRAVASAQGLGFLPVLTERVEIVVWRREAFEPGPRALIEFTRTARFRRKAQALTGYDVDACRVVRFNP